MTTTNTRHTAEQEKIISDELVKIQQAFDLGKWKTHSYPRDGEREHRYFWQDNQIWECTVLTITNPVEYPPEELGKQSVSYCPHYTKSFNKFVYAMWEFDIYRKSRKQAGQQLAKKYQYDDKQKFHITVIDNQTEVCLYAPIALVLPFDAPIHYDPTRREITLQWQTMTATQRANFVQFYNDEQSLLYEQQIQLWQNIHQFINDEQINQRLGLENPAFSPELYHIELPKLIKINDNKL